MENEKLVKIEGAQLALLKRTFFSECSDDEISVALYIAEKFNLDPFKKEIWAVPTFRQGQKKMLIMVGRDGYLASARRHPEFVGMSSGAIYPGDKFKIDYDLGKIEVEQTAESFSKGNPVAAWCVVKRGKEAIIKIVRFEEFDKNSGKPGDIWGKFPSVMLIKCAESMALRSAFGLTGATPADEIREEETMVNVTPTSPTRVKPRISAPVKVEKPEAKTVTETVVNDKGRYETVEKVVPVEVVSEPTPSAQIEENEHEEVETSPIDAPEVMATTKSIDATFGKGTSKRVMVEVLGGIKPISSLNQVEIEKFYRSLIDLEQSGGFGNE